MTGSYYYGRYDDRKDDLHSVLETSPAIDYIIREFEKKQQREQRQSLSTQTSSCSSLGGGDDSSTAPSTPMKNSILEDLTTQIQQEQEQMQRQQRHEEGSTEEQNSISLPMEKDQIGGGSRPSLNDGLFSFVYDMAGCGILSCGGCSETD